MNAAWTSTTRIMTFILEIYYITGGQWSHDEWPSDYHLVVKQPHFSGTIEVDA